MTELRWITSATGPTLKTAVRNLARPVEFGYIAEMQLELFPFDQLTEVDQRAIFTSIRQMYWHLRNLRGGRFGQARARRYYRMVATQKKRLLLAGVEKREILDLLACCRGQCSRVKHPFKPCRYCPV